MACPVCGRMVGGFEATEPDSMHGYYLVGGDHYVVQKQGMRWVAPEYHEMDGEWCEGSGSLCYVGDGNL